MKRSAKRMISLLLVLGMVWAIAPIPLRAAELTATETGAAAVSWEQGTIASIDGQNKSGNSRFRTADYLLLADYGGVGIGEGYTMTNFVYDAAFNYLGTSSWLGSGIPFTTASLMEKYPAGVYFRVVFRADDQRTLTEAAVADSGVRFYWNGEEIPEPDYGFEYEDVAKIGVWQDGAIWDGKLFALNASGSGAVFDVKNGTKLSSFQLDKKDILKPHANSVCFGNTYYSSGDKYPLLYVNIYNNYASAEDRMEGTCCVYRLTETEGSFATELVQVIRIGFTEDLTLWKSKENNGDVRPYGNFTVDTDRNRLYAFVMRDAVKTVRFFGFDIPALDAGAYVDSYGCNLVTLNVGDIREQFDTEHYNYLQGCCYHDGLIYSAQDFGGDAPLRIIDLKEQRVVKTVYLGRAGLRSEPEVLCADPDTGILYYAAADGTLRILNIPGVGYTHAIPESQGVQNAIDRAYALTDVLWTPLKNMPGVNLVDGEWFYQEFEAGTTYRGIPYSGVIDTDTYVGLNVSLDSFLSAVQDEDSVLYTENLFVESYPKKATYFGTVCSKFAQYVLDIPGSYNTANIPNIPGMDTIALPGAYTVEQLELGDVVVDTSYHTAVCTDILYDSDDGVAYIEISEAIPPTVRRLRWTPEEFYESFADYRLCRYQYIDETPAVPSTPVETDHALMPRYGNKYNYRVSTTKGVVDVLESGYYKAVILRDGTVIDEIILNGATTFRFDRSVPGYIEMYLEKADGSRSGSVYACVVESSVTVTDSSDFTSGKLTVTFDGSCGTPLYVQVGSAHAIFCNVEGTQGMAELTFSFSKVSSKQVRVAYRNEYGIYLSPWSTFTTAPNTSTDPLLSQGQYWDGYNLTPSSTTPVVQENKVGYWSYTMVPVEENTTYYSEGATRMWFLDEKGNPISTYNAYKDSEVPFRFTTPEGAAYVSIAYSPKLVEKGAETLIKVALHTPGDINGDGELNNRDLTRLFQYLSDYDVKVVEEALDVNGDGSVNNKDLTRLFQYLSDYDVEIH